MGIIFFEFVLIVIGMVIVVINFFLVVVVDKVGIFLFWEYGEF